MIYPKLFADSNRSIRVITEHYLKKYNHLIKWRNHPSILEIGHGDGGTFRDLFFPYLPKDMKEFVATDLSEEMVEYARKYTIHPSLKIEQLDIATKQVPSDYLNRFDNIFGFFVMHLVNNPLQALINMHKMLKTRGAIFLSFFEHTPLDDVLDKLGRNPEWKEYEIQKIISPYCYRPNPRQEWERDLKATDFQNYDIFEENYAYEFLDDKEFDDLLLSICSFLPNIPSDEVEKFKEVFKKASRQGKLIRTQVRDGKEIISYPNVKILIISASRT